MPDARARVLLDETVEQEVFTDARGYFVFAEVPEVPFELRVTADGRQRLDVTGLLGGDTVALTQPWDEGIVALALPAAPVLQATLRAPHLELQWTVDDPAPVDLLVMRSRSPRVGLLDANVGQPAPAATTLTDPNLPAGTWYYRLLAAYDLPGGRHWVGSNVVEVTVDPAQAFPERLALLMNKVAPDSEQPGAVENVATYVVATADIAAVIPAGLQVAVNSPLTGGQPRAAAYIGPEQTAYRGNEHYYWGNPPVYGGPSRKIDEWDAKYAVNLTGYERAAQEGEHRIAIGGTPVRFQLPAAPDSRIENITLAREDDGQIHIRWQMTEDGQALAGGAGSHGWRYLAKVLQPGRHAGNEAAPYEAERFWSSYCLRDDGANIGFNRVVELASNMPAAQDSIILPPGIFPTGSPVIVMLYAIATADSSNEADSGLEIGRASCRERV